MKSRSIAFVVSIDSRFGIMLLEVRLAFSEVKLVKFLMFCTDVNSLAKESRVLLKFSTFKFISESEREWSLRASILEIHAGPKADDLVNTHLIFVCWGAPENNVLL